MVPAAPEIPKAAFDFLHGKALRPSFDYRDVWLEEHAVAFTVAKAASLDLLADIRSALDKAITEGQTFAGFRKELEPVLQKAGWWGIKKQIDPATGKEIEVQLGSPRRLQTIYDANMRTSWAASQWQRIEETKDALPFLEYQIGPAIRHRPLHESFNGLRLPVDDPFWNTYMPPNGWRCHCRTRQLTQKESDLRGGVSKAPTIEYKSWINTRTGAVESVPAGADPGWGFNVGKAALQLRRDLVAQ